MLMICPTDRGCNVSVVRMEAQILQSFNLCSSCFLHLLLPCLLSFSSVVLLFLTGAESRRRSCRLHHILKMQADSLTRQRGECYAFHHKVFVMVYDVVLEGRNVASSCGLTGINHIRECSRDNVHRSLIQIYRDAVRVIFIQ